MRHRKEVTPDNGVSNPESARLTACALRPVQFRRGESAELPFLAEVEGERWVVRINDFPERALYSLLIGGEEAGDLEGWPPAWHKPA